MILTWHLRLLALIPALRKSATVYNTHLNFSVKTTHAIVQVNKRFIFYKMLYLLDDASPANNISTVLSNFKDEALQRISRAEINIKKLNRIIKPLVVISLNKCQKLSMVRMVISI